MNVLLAAAAMASAQPGPAAVNGPAAILEAALAPMADGERPGCAAGLVENGRLTHQRAAGLADLQSRTPITPTTAFNIASLSKQFTAAAAVLLMAEGRLSEEDDIRRWIPELRDYGRVIRVRDLLQHSSGLRNHMALAAFQPGDGLPTHGQALASVFRQSALNFPPGSRHQYESPSYVLLAQVIARAADKPFEEVLAERIFRPLGMTRTGFAVSGAARAYNALGNGSFALNDRVNQARGSSGLYSTVEDMAKWLAALGGGRFGGAGFLRRMASGGRLSDGTVIDYGYGLSVNGAPGDGLAIGHGGQTAGYRSRFHFVPRRGFGVIMLCNVSNAPVGAADEALAAWRAETGLPGAGTAEPAAQPLQPGEAGRYVGHYHDAVTDTVRTFAVQDGGLALSYYGSLIPLTPLGGGRFALGGDVTFAFGPGMLDAREPNQPLVRYRRLPPPRPEAASHYVGTYRSVDLDTPLVLRAEGSDLLLTLKEREIRLRPLAPDSFAAPESDFVKVTFLFDYGRAVGLTLTTGSGINRMRFDRISPTG